MARAGAVALGLTLAATTAASARPASETHLANGTLNLQGTLRVRSTPMQCPRISDLLGR